MTDDIHVFIVDLPPHINEMVTPCFCGYCIYIDVKLSPEGRKKAYHHALAHIENNDWEKEDANEIENERHKS